MQKLQTKKAAPLPTPLRNGALAPAGPSDETQMADLPPHAKVDTWFATNYVYSCCYDVLFEILSLYLTIVSSPGIPRAKESQPPYDPEGGARSVNDTPLASEPPAPELPPAVPTDSDHQQKPDEGIDEPW